VKAKSTPGMPDPLQGAQMFGSALSEVWKSMQGVSLEPQAWGSLQSEYLQNATALWNDSLSALQPSSGSAASVKTSGKPALKDRRFAASEWAANPAASYMAQMYLLNARTLMQMAESVQGDPKTKARIRFAVQQWVDAASPSNYLATNPEALQRALQTKGESLSKGMQQLMEDMRKGHVSQTDESVFEVGRNVASSEGAVVFENELFQLIEYKPLTAKVHERPMRFVPP